MDFNTELTKRLLQGDNINHLLKEAIENGINQLLQVELTEHLNYPKHSVEGYNTGNSRNGGYNRKIYSEYGILISIFHEIVTENSSKKLLKLIKEIPKN